MIDAFMSWLVAYSYLQSRQIIWILNMFTFKHFYHIIIQWLEKYKEREREERLPHNYT